MSVGPETTRGRDRIRTVVDDVGAVVALALVVAAVPVVRMLMWVLGGSPVQYADYWLIIDGLLKRSGWPSPRDLVDLYNGHLMVLPKLVYWLNIRAFGGSNITLGVFVVGVAGATAALLLRIVPRGRAVHPAVTAAVVVATTAFLFAPHGAWSFLRSMSGTAWLLANLFAVAAVVVAHLLDRRLLALGLACLSALSYGTGVVAFPGLLVVLLLSDRRIDWRRQWPPVVVGAGFAAWYRLVEDGTLDEVARPGPWTTVLNACSLVGSVVSPTSETGARWAGAVLVLAGVVLAVVAVRGRTGRAHPWIAVLVYSSGGSLLIGYGRAEFTDFLDSRYVCIGALAWISTLALLALVAGRHAVVAAPIAAAAALVVLSGQDAVRATEATRLDQRELADAQRIGVADGSQLWIGLRVPMPPLGERLEAADHHPFDGRYEADCGLLGTVLDGTLLRTIGDDGTTGSGTVGRPTSLPRGLLVRGFVDGGEADIECAVVIDRADEVVGVGTWGRERLRLDGTADDLGVRAVAPRDVQGPRLVVRFEGSDDLWVLDLGAA